MGVLFISTFVTPQHVIYDSCPFGRLSIMIRLTLVDNARVGFQAGQKCSSYYVGSIYGASDSFRYLLCFPLNVDGEHRIFGWNTFVIP